MIEVLSFNYKEECCITLHYTKVEEKKTNSSARKKKMNSEIVTIQVSPSLGSYIDMMIRMIRKSCHLKQFNHRL